MSTGLDDSWDDVSEKGPLLDKTVLHSFTAAGFTASGFTADGFTADGFTMFHRWWFHSLGPNDGWRQVVSNDLDIIAVANLDEAGF